MNKIGSKSYTVILTKQEENMSDLSAITTVQELVEFLSDFLEKVPTQEYVDQQLEKKVGVETLSALIPQLVSRIDFEQRMFAKANKADLINAVAGKADRNEVSSGIARKANLSALYNLEGKLNKIFPFKTVENIAERNNLFGEDLEKVVLVIDATDDRKLSADVHGAMYMWSKARREWVLQSEIKYTDNQIAYSRILGRPVSSAAEIDIVVAAVIEKIEYVRKLHEIYTKMHAHSSTIEDIDNAVAVKHSHQDALEIMDIDDSDFIPIVRNGELVKVKARTLKTYMNQ